MITYNAANNYITITEETSAVLITLEDALGTITTDRISAIMKQRKPGGTLQDKSLNGIIE